MTLDTESPPPCAQPGHWSGIARRWEQVGAPLRPGPADLAAFTAAIDAWASTHGAPRALILGVTPELFRLPWPTGSVVVAADHTPAMIDALWPGPRGTAILAEWTELPLADGSQDVVLCDGGLHLLAHPQSQAALVRSLRRVLAPGGRLILRLFVPPTERERPELVLRELLEGRIPSLNVLKLRLAMALQERPEDGVRLGEVWRALSSVAPDLDALADRIGWTRPHLAAIETYRDSVARYHFVDLDAVRRCFCAAPGGFALLHATTPTYHLGERCPTIVFRRTEAQGLDARMRTTS